MERATDVSIKLYEIIERYNVMNNKNINAFFDLPLGDLVDDSVIGEKLTYVKDKGSKGCFYLNLARTFLYFDDVTQVYLFNNFLS